MKKRNEYHFSTIGIGESRRYEAKNFRAQCTIRAAASSYARYYEIKLKCRIDEDGSMVVTRH